MERFGIGFEGTSLKKEEVILDSSMVEHSAVNRVVVGSSPTRGVFPYKESVAVKRRNSCEKRKAPWSSG